MAIHWSEIDNNKMNIQILSETGYQQFIKDLSSDASR